MKASASASAIETAFPSAAREPGREAPSREAPSREAPSREAAQGGLEDPLLRLAERLVATCPSPALLIDASGDLRAVNRAAVELLGLGEDLAGRPSRSLFGLGWRELELIARDGDADLLTDLPGAEGRRSLRVRLERVESWRGEILALAAFLEPAEIAATGRRSGARRQGFAALFGHDPALLATKAAAERFAGTLLPLLLLASTGTGKELLARAIHLASPRHQRPFVAINCGALSPHLLESELFGYAPGAFTGASRQGNEGKIGAARGGTLFLDEVAEMPGPLQALMLRVLEDGTYYRVGESLPRQADVRLICATCRDLPRLVAEGGFRQDLYYRINGACLSLPPVASRQDLPELIHHLLAELAIEEELAAPPPIEASAFEHLLRHPWPGNVRQLKTALRHALILSGGATLRLENLPAELTGRLPGMALVPAAPSIARIEAAAGHAEAAPANPASAENTARERASAEPAGPAATPHLTLRELEAERLRRVLELEAGNLSRVAQKLGIARSTLYRRLRKHGFLAEEPSAEGSATGAGSAAEAAPI